MDDDSTDKPGDGDIVKAVEEFYSAKIADARAQRWIGDVLVQVQAERWTVPIVRARLSEASKGIQRIVRRPGPKGDRGFWPATITVLTKADENEMYQAGQLSDFFDEHNRSVVGMDRRKVTRVVEAIAWPATYLSDDAHEFKRHALQIWMQCEAFGWKWGRHSKEISSARSVANRQRDRAIEVIMEGLMRDGVLP